jgi:hypothetical protein
MISSLVSSHHHTMRSLASRNSIDPRFGFFSIDLSQMGETWYFETDFSVDVKLICQNSFLFIKW